MLCYYINATNQVQIARIANIAACYFERVVFPGQRLLFEAVPEAILEVQTPLKTRERFRCTYLRVVEPSSESSPD